MPSRRNVSGVDAHQVTHLGQRGEGRGELSGKQGVFALMRRTLPAYGAGCSTVTTRSIPTDSNVWVGPPGQRIVANSILS